MKDGQNVCAHQDNDGIFMASVYEFVSRDLVHFQIYHEDVNKHEISSRTSSEVAAFNAAWHH